MSVIELRAIPAENVLPLSRCDICIVGSGPAGTTLAQELSNTNLRVTLLESGGMDRDPLVDALDEIDNVGRARASDQWSVRNRIVGGSSHTWGGRCGPFDAIDYEERPWVPYSGWPIDGAELEPYLARTVSHLGLAFGNGYNDERFWSIAKRERPTPDLDPDVLMPFFWQFSRDAEEAYPYEYMRFGRHLAKRLGSNVTLVTGATVQSVQVSDSGGAVRSVRFATVDGGRQVLAASVVVLCCGGIENARTLMNSNETKPHGVGNDHDQLGRYLMDHLRGSVATFSLPGSDGLQKRFGRYNVSRHFFRAGFRLNPDIQRREELLNCAAWLGEVLAPDDPWDALRRIAGRTPKLPQDVFSVIANGSLLLRGLKDFLGARNGVPRKLTELNLQCMCEQVPNPDSRVTLSERRDRLGIRLPRVDWRSHSDESRTMRRMAQLAVEELPKAGLPAPKLEEWVRDGDEIPSTFVDVAHPTGTTRMSAEPGHGVVDANCEVHGVNGLFVLGSSVFPTAGHCNPTQMIVALAVRLADHIKAVHPYREPVPAAAHARSA
uniref:GMC family oxidoreductase n=1 Tax=Neorhizobium sp. EC2-8 TaxID=3129230 RepID=UPI0031018687